MIWEDHKLYIGKAGTVGDRAGNFAVQNSDLLLVLGSRLNIRQVSYNYKMFARASKKLSGLMLIKQNSINIQLNHT